MGEQLEFSFVNEELYYVAPVFSITNSFIGINIDDIVSIQPMTTPCSRIFELQQYNYDQNISISGVL